VSNSHAIIALETVALERWCQGDPSGFLELSLPDVVYFDPFLPERINGLGALSEYYESIRGKIFSPRFEIIDPLVQEIGEAAVLTFRFNSYGKSEGSVMRWNCTEVYRRSGESWKIAQTHWSFTAPVSGS